MDERELEELLRGGLATHAEDADTTAPVVDRVRADVGRRRRTRWSAVAAAAAIAVIAGGTSVVALRGDEPSRNVDLPPAADSQSAVDGEWRTEFWADLAVDVPADWGYGGAPDAKGLACYPEAMVGPDGEYVDGGHGLGYVGRPISGTDVCALVPKAWEPAAPYVWLGADIEPGTYEYDNGYVQETVEVNGSTLTVGTPDDALREEILSTARGGEICMSELPTEGSIAHDRAPAGAEATSLRVCVYKADDVGSESARLAYAGDLGRGALTEYEAALEGAERGGLDGCPTASVVWDTWVVLELVAADGSIVRQDVAQTVCWLSIEVDARRLWGDATRSVSLSPQLVEPWAGGGIRATVHGSAMISGTDWLDDYFIGPQG